ncbi:MAG TPA: hypothetical protein VLS91_02495 [Acidimicrobiales bacterium]|nr:hypothetical protein [Acidimicrobiales bacterium]
MKMSNDTYCVTFTGPHTQERYYRDARGWLKVSSRGRVFRMTAEQVLNHLLPALSLDRRGLTVRVEHFATPYWQSPAARADSKSSPDAENPE